jgi:hypothetical protein
MRLGKEVTPVAKIMRCDCGYADRGETDDELVANVQKYARGPRHGDHQVMVGEKTHGKAKEDKR